eukprot:TRINITY_DN2161_c0_g3_i1.p2 TRINITY_DN2161_c0_g3~~TRINITY_DN2161_c0_g3_i1.p2  ORF type:complete len:108 (+),score=3.68 TRINITY_DN2161_c0_g3_i1:55-378(+)
MPIVTSQLKVLFIQLLSILNCGMFPLSMSAAFGALLYELSITKTRKLNFLMKVHSVKLGLYLAFSAIYYAMLHILTIICVLAFAHINEQLLQVVAGANIVCAVLLLG